jgi:glycerol kinase
MDRTFSPHLKDSEIHSLIKGWDRAVRAAKAWADEKEV